MRAPGVAYPACGSERGYYRHRDHGEVPCQLCCDARRSAEASRAEQPAEPVLPQPLMYALAKAGREPAEALTTADRARLVAELDARGWSVLRIAEHTRMTAYTTDRIRARLVAAGVTAPPTRTNLGETA